MSAESKIKKDRKKTIAAILAGVNAFITEEEERSLAITEKFKKPAPQMKIWPILGREEMMRMRTIWQRRIV